MALNYTSANASNTSGTLHISSGGSDVADINLVGAYSVANFQITSDSSGHIKIIDPLQGPSQSSASVSAGNISGLLETPITSSSAVQSNFVSSTGDEFSGKNLALLVNQMASTFVTVTESGTWKEQTEETQSWPQSIVTSPHAGSVI
jgi:hypothetical protein